LAVFLPLILNGKSDTPYAPYRFIYLHVLKRLFSNNELSAVVIFNYGIRWKPRFNWRSYTTDGNTAPERQESPNNIRSLGRLYPPKPAKQPLLVQAHQRCG